MFSRQEVSGAVTKKKALPFPRFENYSNFSHLNYIVMNEVEIYQRQTQRIRRTGNHVPLRFQYLFCITIAACSTMLSRIYRWGIFPIHWVSPPLFFVDGDEICIYRYLKQIDYL